MSITTCGTKSRLGNLQGCQHRTKIAAAGYVFPHYTWNIAEQSSISILSMVDLYGKYVGVVVSPEVNGVFR